MNVFRDEGDALDQADITRQNKVRIESFTTMKVADVSAWHQSFANAQPESRLADFDIRDRTPPEKKEGYIVTLKGFHLHNFENPKDEEFKMQNRLYLENTLLKNLRQWELNSGGVTVPVGKIGISHPILAFSLKTQVPYDPNERAGGAITGGPRGTGGYAAGGSGPGSMTLGFGNSRREREYDEEEGLGGGNASLNQNLRGGVGGVGTTGPLLAETEMKEIKMIDRTDFVVQFVWIPTLEDDRKDVDPRPAVVEGTDAAVKK